MGVLDALTKVGAQEGDLVMVADLDFDYSPTETRHMRDVPDYLLEVSPAARGSGTARY